MLARSIGTVGWVTKVVLWDFDETLAERPGRWWGCMLEIIGRRDPGCVADGQALREALRAFYPWRSPEVVHEHLNDPDDWWAALQPGLATAAVAAGLDPLDADAVAADGELETGVGGAGLGLDDGVATRRIDERDLPEVHAHPINTLAGTVVDNAKVRGDGRAGLQVELTGHTQHDRALLAGNGCRETDARPSVAAAASLGWCDGGGTTPGAW